MSNPQSPHQKTLAILADLKFVRIGRFKDGGFAIARDWQPKCGVYVWLAEDEGVARALRIGIACGRRGLASRYASYNRWLAGKFKPDDAREQHVAFLMRTRLDNAVQVFGLELDDRDAALALESRLRAQFGSALDLDLMAPGGWIHSEMIRWRATRVQRTECAVETKKMARAERAISLADLPAEPALIIRITREWRTGLSDEQLYERVRRYWKLRPDRKAAPPKIAYGVADGVIRAVYAIDGWETYDMATEAKRRDRADLNPHAAGIRVGFIGRRLAQLDHLEGMRLTDCPKSQNPVGYLNC
jgi:hypothetical protein